MATETKEVEVQVKHPMEEVLDIEPGTTNMTKVERNSDLVIASEYDEKDNEIEEQFQEVYDAAMGAFEGQMEEAELVEGKYKARNGEVAVQFLNTALNAAKEKSGLKQHKDKTALAEGKLAGDGSRRDKDVIIADRNELLKALFGKEQEEPIDGEFSEVPPEETEDSTEE